MIPDYNLACPTAADLQDSLLTILSEADAQSALRVALRDVGAVPDELDQMPPERLQALGLALARQRGLPAVIGRSFAIRVGSYLHLKETHHAAR